MIQFLAPYSDTIGIIGVSFILLAYFLINTNRVTSASIKYLSLNFTGAWLILFSLYYHWNLASALIEFAWINISLLGFYRVLKKRSLGAAKRNPSE